MYQAFWYTDDNKKNIYATNNRNNHALRSPLPQEVKRQKSGAEILLEIAEMAEKENWTGPKDLSEKHNENFIEAWEKEHK